MSLPGTHVLTAVVVMPRAFDELAAMLSRLAKQTLASRLEDGDELGELPDLLLRGVRDRLDRAR
jgi:hypothetical protein